MVDTTMDTATTVYEGHALPVTVRVDGDLSVPVKVELSTLSRTAIGIYVHNIILDLICS